QKELYMSICWKITSDATEIDDYFRAYCSWGQNVVTPFPAGDKAEETKMKTSLTHTEEDSFNHLY
ncbi:hypothetical protein CEXT_520661, partial [Caerostris extrusa]